MDCRSLRQTKQVIPSLEVVVIVGNVAWRTRGWSKFAVADFHLGFAFEVVG